MLVLLQEQTDPDVPRSKLAEAIQHNGCNRRILVDLAGELAVGKLDAELNQEQK